MKKRRIVTAFWENSVLTDDNGKNNNKITALIFVGKNRMNIFKRESKNKVAARLVREQIIALHAKEITQPPHTPE